MQNVRVERRQAPAGEFATIFVGDTAAYTTLNAAGDDDAVIIAKWQAGGILSQDTVGYSFNPSDIDVDLWTSVGATRVVFVLVNEDGEDASEDEESEMAVRIVNANYTG